MLDFYMPAEEEEDEDDCGEGEEEEGEEGEGEIHEMEEDDNPNRGDEEDLSKIPIASYAMLTVEWISHLRSGTFHTL